MHHPNDQGQRHSPTYRAADARPHENPADAGHEADEKYGLIALTSIIVGLMLVGVVQFSLAWAMAH